VLRQIEEGTARLKTVLGDLLFMARDSKSSQAHVDVVRVLESTISLVRSGAAPGVELVTELAPCPAIVAHPTKLGQVFLNVILNALQAVEGRAGGVVRVSLVDRSKDGFRDVVVRDDGPGIPPDRLPRVFDPFFTTKPEGTGLGLSISHAIVRAHGGSIRVESKVGEGTSVKVTLPLSPPPDVPANAH
jgi:signal transduction histidine kinase